MDQPYFDKASQNDPKFAGKTPAGAERISYACLVWPWHCYAFHLLIASPDVKAGGIIVFSLYFWVYCTIAGWFIQDCTVKIQWSCTVYTFQQYNAVIPPILTKKLIQTEYIKPNSPTHPNRKFCTNLKNQ